LKSFSLHSSSLVGAIFDRLSRSSVPRVSELPVHSREWFSNSIALSHQ
jgi:hypothetical protein